MTSKYSSGSREASGLNLFIYLFYFGGEGSLLLAWKIFSETKELWFAMEIYISISGK